MSEKELEIICQICLTADDGCRYCATELLKKLAFKFPKYEEWIKNFYLKYKLGEIENFKPSFSCVCSFDFMTEEYLNANTNKI